MIKSNSNKSWEENVWSHLVVYLGIKPDQTWPTQLSNVDTKSLLLKNQNHVAILKFSLASAQP